MITVSTFFCEECESHVQAVSAGFIHMHWQGQPMGHVCPLPYHFQKERIPHEPQDRIRSTKETTLPATAAAVHQQSQRKGQALLLQLRTGQGSPAATAL